MKLRDWIDTLPNGLDTEVLGTLELTTDGCILASQATVYFPMLNSDGDVSVYEWDVGSLDSQVLMMEYYSTRAAAEQAAKEAK